MKTSILLGIFLAMVMLSCQKNEPEVTPTPPEVEPDYFPLTVGSYWVYNTYQIDSLGNENLFSENDTLRIINKMNINGEEFSVFYGKKYISNNKIEMYFRDSAGYIIDEKGNIEMSAIDFSDTLYTNFEVRTNDTLFLQYTNMDKQNGTIQVPSGNFENVLNRHLTFFYWDNPENSRIQLKNQYAPDAGRIIKQYSYVNFYLTNKEFYEERLMEYYIADEENESQD